MVGRCSEKNDKRHIQTQNPIPSIFLMAFLGVYVFTGFGAESFGFEETSSTYYGETNLADGWIFSDCIRGFLVYVEIVQTIFQRG